MFWGMFISYSYRALLSVVILTITKEYGYSNEEQGYISSAFFIGYILLQLPAGLLLSTSSSLTTHRYINGYIFLWLSICLPSLCTLFTPSVAGNLFFFIIIRIATGLFESLFYPTIHSLTSVWFPYEERSRAIGFIWSGAYIGTCTTIYISGILIETTKSWSIVFYVFGILGLLWSIAWYTLASPLPENHPRISKNEKEYILSLRHRTMDPSKVVEDVSFSTSTNTSSSSFTLYRILYENIRQIPWRIFLTHSAVWAIIIQHTTHNYIFYMLLTWLPTYLEKLFTSVDISIVALYTFVPYLCCFVSSLASGYIADDLIKQQIFTTVQVRKIMQFIAETIPAVALVMICFITYKPFVLFLFTIAIGCLGFNGGGYSCSHFDIAPSYSSLLMGLGNTFATLPGIIAPIIVGKLTQEPHNDLDHYHIAFLLASGITILGYIVFFMYAEGEVLPCFRTEEETGTTEKENRSTGVDNEEEKNEVGDGEEDEENNYGDEESMNDADIDEDTLENGGRRVRTNRQEIRKEEEIKLLRVSTKSTGKR